MFYTLMCHFLITTTKEQMEHLSQKVTFSIFRSSVLTTTQIKCRIQNHCAQLALDDVALLI
jgi:hypothetical protein